MGKSVFIAEKPSVAQEFAKALHAQFYYTIKKRKRKRFFQKEPDFFTDISVKIA